MKETLVFIDEGLLSKLSKYFGEVGGISYE